MLYSVRAVPDLNGKRGVEGADAARRGVDPGQHGATGTPGRKNLRNPNRRRNRRQAPHPRPGRRVAPEERQPEQANVADTTLARRSEDRGRGQVARTDLHVAKRGGSRDVIEAETRSATRCAHHQDHHVAPGTPTQGNQRCPTGDPRQHGAAGAPGRKKLRAADRRCCRARGTDRNWTRGRPQDVVVAGHRQANSVRVCAPASRRVASLRPRSAGLTALTPAPRTLVQTGSCRRCSLIHPLHVVVDVPSRMTLFRATADIEDEILVKRLIRDPDAGWLVQSDNRNKRAWRTRPWPEEGQIVGQVKWLGRTFT